MLSRTCSFGSGFMAPVLMPFLIMPFWRQLPKPIICESCSEISAAWRRIAKEFPMMENATTNIYISSARGASVCAFKRLVHLPFSVFEMRTSASQAQLARTCSPSRANEAGQEARPKTKKQAKKRGPKQKRRVRARPHTRKQSKRRGPK